MSDNFQSAGSERERARAPSTEPGQGRRTAGVAQIASAVGNRGFARTVARMRDGEGILPGGVVHPDVEAAIAAAGGSGSPAAGTVAAEVGTALGDPLSDVRVHTDGAAAALARSVSARAFTVDNDIFFGSGEYRPGTPAGRELLSHELVHVVQQRGAPRSGPLTVSQPGDVLEREAEDVARGL